MAAGAGVGAGAGMGANVGVGADPTAGADVAAGARGSEAGCALDPSQVGCVFDCDGTLLDTMGIWHDMETELARRSNATLTPDDRAVLITCTIPECAAFFHERFGLGVSADEVVGMINEFMLDYYRNHVEAKPGALAFARGLAERGVRMTVASSSPHAFLVAGLERCGFAPLLDGILSVDDVGASKREPVIWHRAREIMGTLPGLTWGVEDSTYAIRTIKAAGYRAIGIHDLDVNGTWDELTTEADHAIRSFEELDADTFLAWNRR